MYRQPDPQRAQMISHFQDWGIPTAQCLVEITKHPERMCFCIWWAAKWDRFSKELSFGCNPGRNSIHYRAANEGYDQLGARDHRTYLEELRICMFATGKKTLVEFDESVIALIH